MLQLLPFPNSYFFSNDIATHMLTPALPSVMFPPSPTNTHAHTWT